MRILSGFERLLLLGGLLLVAAYAAAASIALFTPLRTSRFLAKSSGHRPPARKTHSAEFANSAFSLMVTEAH